MQVSTAKKAMFETMPVSKALIAMAVPTIISQLITLVYNMADTFFIGRAGNPNMTAGISACYTLVVLTLVVCNLFGIGTGNMIARLNGKGEYDRARRICVLGFYCTVAASLLYGGVILAFMNSILRFLGASDVTIGYAKTYCLIVVVIGALPSILSTTLAHLLRNVGYSKQASWGLSGGGILNIALDPLFMFVLLPEGQEVFGAAIATLISNVLSCAYLLWQFFKISKTATLDANPKYFRKMEWKDFSELFMTGLPSALLVGLYDLISIFLFSLMGPYGDLSEAAIGIVIKIERIPNSIGIGLSQSMMPLVAYNYGSGNRKRMNKFIKTGRMYGIIMTLCCIAIYQIFARPLCGFFLSTSKGDVAASLETIALEVTFLRFRCLASPMMFLNYQSSYCMQAIGGTRDTIIHCIVRVFVFNLPIMYLFNHLWGANGLTASLMVGELFSCILAMILLTMRSRKLEREKSDNKA